MKPVARSFSNLMEEIATIEDVEAINEELTWIVDQGEGADMVKEEMERMIRPRSLKAMIKDKEANQVDWFDYAKEALIWLKQLPVMELTLAYEPSPVALDRMVKKARDLSVKPMVLSLIVNPAILGGAIVVVKGEYRDYSLSAKLSNLMTESYGGFKV